jgi:glycosyltransferase involved in cell wall biosynthesis
MKVLWFSHILPFPPRGGNLQRSFNLIREMSKSCEISLVAFNAQGERADRVATYAAELSKYCGQVEIWELPFPRRRARWWGKLALSPLYDDPFTSRELWSRELEARWRRLLDRHAGSLLHMDSLDLGMFARSLDGFRKVLNHHNCESAMAERRAHRETNPLKRAYLRLHAGKLADLERRLCHQFEVNTVVSELDGQTLRARNPRAHVHVVENGTDTHFFAPGGEAEEPRSLIFAGSLDWYPNLSAIRFFLREVWPLLRQQDPGVHLTLAGQKPPAWLTRLAASNPSLRLVPNPEDIRPWVRRAAVFVCPIRDGGGTRLKILDAMALGKAVVSTSIGCEGLRVKDGENILVADTPHDFAQAVRSVLENEDLRRRVEAAARTLVEAEYSWERIAAHLAQAYRCAAGGHCEGRSARETVDTHEAGKRG